MKLKIILSNILKKIKTTFFNIEQSLPYIPDFSDIWNIIKIFSVSFLICIIYSFSKIYKASDIFFMLEINMKTFTPYVVTMLLFLYFSSSFLKKINQAIAICVIFLLNIFSVYFVFSSVNKDFLLFFQNNAGTLDVAFILPNHIKFLYILCRIMAFIELENIMLCYLPPILYCI